MIRHTYWVFGIVTCFSLLGCGGGDNQTISETMLPTNAPITGGGSTESDTSDNGSSAEMTPSATSALDQLLRQRLNAQGISQSPAANLARVDISEPLAQLGKKLFYSKSLSGNLDTACASCHHPTLGGGDGLSFPIGVEAIRPEILGLGRENFTGLPVIGRNSPSAFNSALLEQGLFWDSRIARLPSGGISTPESGFGFLDALASKDILAVQAAFPVVVAAEMRGHFNTGATTAHGVRQYLADRLAQRATAASDLLLNQWLVAFQQGFESSADAEQLITFDNIALALAQFERSMMFVDSPWQHYVAGDINAISEQQKQGALLFFSSAQQGGAGCSICHSGTKLTDQRHHTVAFPQFGPGAGDGPTADDDFGRARVTGNDADRYRFRTPSLHNVALTAPYGHAGSYRTLRQVVRHYANPRGRVEDFFQQQQSCQLTQFNPHPECDRLYPNSQTHSRAALAKLSQEQADNTSLFANINLNNDEVAALVAFLESLTDPCLTQPSCLQPWIANSNLDNPDDQVLIGTDSSGAPL